jgi:predicted hotdog family 3-hydroxylacyl-ACP dehydratase
MSDSVIHVDQLKSYLPHRAPMIWVDEVISVGDDSGIIAVELKEDAHYFDTVNLRNTSFIEWMAQGWGYLVGAKLLNSGKLVQPKRAFLAGVNNFEVHYNPQLIPGDMVFVHLKLRKDLGQVMMVDGRILFGEEQACICTARLKLFIES